RRSLRRCVANDGADAARDFTVRPWMTAQIPLTSLFGRRLHGGLPSLPGLRSTGSCPCRSCRLTSLQAGSARWCLSSRWRRNPIYLGLFLGLIGLAIAFDNLWLLSALRPRHPLRANIWQIATYRGR